jgi:hypothetical protein
MSLSREKTASAAQVCGNGADVCVQSTWCGCPKRPHSLLRNSCSRSWSLGRMRLIVRVMTLLLPFLLVLPPGMAAAARHTRAAVEECSPRSAPYRSRSQPYEQLLAADGSAEVYTLGAGPPPAPPRPGYPMTEESRRQVYGCVFGRRGAFKLGEVIHREGVGKYMEEVEFGDSDEVLAGPVVAFEYRATHTSARGCFEVVVENLQTGRTLRREPSGLSPFPGEQCGAGVVPSIVVKSDGAVAWIADAGDSTGSLQVHVADAQGSRVVASGTDIDPSSLALAGSTLYWTQGGSPLSAVLN